MLDTHAGTARVAAERYLSQASVQLLDIELKKPIQSTLHEAGNYRLDLSLAPSRNKTQVRYVRHWAPNRFASPGKVFLLPPGEAMQLQSEAGTDRALVCRLTGAYLAGLAGTELTWQERELEASLDIRDARIVGLMSRLADEILRPGLASDFLVEAVMVEIAVELLRYRSALRDGKAAVLTSQRLRVVDERLEEDSVPTLAELAGLCGISVRQLTRDFRESRGVSLGRYVADRRLDRAKQRLLHGESVKAVAYAMGFSSPATFCKAFRRGVGRTPGYYKRTGRQPAKA